MKRVLITGANGFVGSYLISHLVKMGFSVTATVRHPLSRFIEPQAKLVVCHQSADYEALLSEMDAIIHCGGVAHRPSAPSEEFELGNTRWTNDLAGAVARSRSCRTMVHLSSIAARKYDEGSFESRGLTTRDPYGASKKAAEAAVLALREEGKLGVNLRPPLIYGQGAPGNWAKLRALACRPVPLPFANVRVKRQYLAMTALARAIEAVLRQSEISGAAATACYEIADREPVSLPEIIRVLRSASGRRSLLFSGPIPLMDRGLRLLRREGIADALFKPLKVDWRPFAEMFAWQPESSTLDAMKRSVI